jgi:hypothetical protein
MLPASNLRCLDLSTEPRLDLIQRGQIYPAIISPELKGLMVQHLSAAWTIKSCFVLTVLHILRFPAAR